MRPTTLLVPSTTFLVLLAVGCAHAPDTLDDDEPIPPPVAESRWAGSVALPGGNALEFSVHIAEGGAAGTISIPAQGVTDAPLSDVSDDGADIAFTLPVPAAPARFAALREADGQNATGTLNQGGMELPLRLRKLAAGEAAAAGPNRPQTPEPPFPYASRDASWENAADGVTLAGTLTYPDDGAPHPAVLLITGSGAQDRDETIFAHKPFAVLADALTRRGFAVLRVDDRGVGASTAGTGALTVQSNLRDVLASAAFLAAQPEADPSRVGLVGHSEGGILVAMAAAAEPERVAFVVALAGTGVRGDALLGLQVAALERAEGVPEPQIASDVAQQAALMKLVVDGADEVALRAALDQAVRARLESGSDEEKAQIQQVGVDKLVEQQLTQLTQPWLRSFLVLDPTESWRQVRCPVLVLIGDKDRQVPAAENLAGIRAALEAGKNPDATLETVAGVNHLFQTAGTGAPSEYATIEETMAPTVLARIGDWLSEKADLAGAPQR